MGSNCKIISSSFAICSANARGEFIIFLSVCCSHSHSSPRSWHCKPTTRSTSTAARCCKPFLDKVCYSTSTAARCCKPFLDKVCCIYVYVVPHACSWLFAFTCSCQPANPIRNPAAYSLTNFQPGSQNHKLLCDLAEWVDCCNLRAFIHVETAQNSPSEECICRIPLHGVFANANLDVSTHGRSFDGFLYHGTSWSHLPAIVSAGCLLRCSVPTRGFHAIWAAEALDRALMYSPPALLGGRAIQCVVGLKAFRIKASHFRSTDKQFMLRECWHELHWLYICDYKQQGLYRSHVLPLAETLPGFVWDPSYSNWEPLPPPWVVTNGDATTSVVSGVPEIPRPRATVP